MPTRPATYGARTQGRRSTESWRRTAARDLFGTQSELNACHAPMHAGMAFGLRPARTGLAGLAPSGQGLRSRRERSPVTRAIARIRLAS